MTLFDVATVQSFAPERTLIKHHSFYYNILLRDDKEYPFIKLTLMKTPKGRKKENDWMMVLTIGPLLIHGKYILCENNIPIFPLSAVRDMSSIMLKDPAITITRKCVLVILEVDRTLYLGL